MTDPLSKEATASDIARAVMQRYQKPADRAAAGKK